MLWIVRSLLLAFLFVGIESGAHAQTIRVCFSNWDPFHTQSSSGVEGISIDLTVRILTELGFIAQFQELPQRRCLESVRAGRMDMALSVRDQRGLASSSAAKTVLALGVLVPFRTPAPNPSSRSAERPRIGVSAQHDLGDVARRRPDWILESVPHDILNFEKLRRGYLDGIVADLTWVFRRNMLDRYAARVDRTIYFEPQLLPDAFRPGLEDVRDRYDAVLRRLLDDGVVDKVYTEYGIPPLSAVMSTPSNGRNGNRDPEAALQ